MPKRTRKSTETLDTVQNARRVSLEAIAQRDTFRANLDNAQLSIQFMPLCDHRFLGPRSSVQEEREQVGLLLVHHSEKLLKLPVGVIANIRIFTAGPLHSRCAAHTIPAF